jgi:hypothetical protein
MRRGILFIIVALLLSSCLGSKVQSTSTPDAQMVMTSVQLTVSAKLTSNAASIPSATLTPTMTETVISTTAVPASPTPTITSAVTLTRSPLADKAELTNQSVPDQSKFNPGAPFKVTWTFKNVGTTTWTTAYSAKFWSDDLMGSPDTITFSKEVKPNDSIDITMSFTAPTTIGSAKSSWWLQNADGANFFPFFVAIEVISALPTPPTATVTVAPSATATIHATPTMTVTSTP